MPSFARTRTVVKGASHDFDDEECFDLGPLEEQEAEQPPQQVLEASQLFEDEECFDLCPLEEEQEEGVAAEQPQVLATPQEQEKKVEKDRIRLEMQYEIFEAKDDCDLEDISTCASRCDDCMGAGTTNCRFCMGRITISFVGANDMPCPVCDQKGVEVCQKCRGSGQVASWTTLTDFKPM